MKDVLVLNGVEFDSRLMHCFGTPLNSIDSVNFAVKLIKESGTSFLTLYTHGDFDNFKSIDDFPIGYAGLKFADIKNELDLGAYTILVNTNHALSTEEAVHKAKRGSELIGSKYIKLEVLNKKGTKPINNQVLNAAKILIKEGYTVLPIIDRFDISIAKELEALGCACIRVLLSDICSGDGLKNPEFFQKVCESVSIPIIAEGGIRCPEDAYNTLALGASGVLVNSVMFSYKDPIEFIKSLKSSIAAGREAYLCNLKRSE